MPNKKKFSTRFIKNSILASSSFVINLALLYLYFTMFGIPYHIAIPLTFATTTTINYSVNRRWIFPDAKRSNSSSFIFFLGLAVVGVAVITLGTVILVEQFEWNVYIARIAMGTLTSIVGFLLNGRYNFQVM